MSLFSGSSNQGPGFLENTAGQFHQAAPRYIADGSPLTQWVPANSQNQFFKRVIQNFHKAATSLQHAFFKYVMPIEEYTGDGMYVLNEITEFPAIVLAKRPIGVPGDESFSRKWATQIKLERYGLTADTYDDSLKTDEGKAAYKIKIIQQKEALAGSLMVIGCEAMMTSGEDAMSNLVYFATGAMSIKVKELRNTITRNLVGIINKQTASLKIMAVACNDLFSYYQESLRIWVMSSSTRDLLDTRAWVPNVPAVPLSTPSAPGVINGDQSFYASDGTLIVVIPPMPKNQSGEMFEPMKQSVFASSYVPLKTKHGYVSVSLAHAKDVAFTNLSIYKVLEHDPLLVPAGTTTNYRHLVDEVFSKLTGVINKMRPNPALGQVAVDTMVATMENFGDGSYQQYKVNRDGMKESDWARRAKDSRFPFISHDEDGEVTADAIRTLSQASQDSLPTGNQNHDTISGDFSSPMYRLLQAAAREMLAGYGFRGNDDDTWETASCIAEKILTADPSYRLPKDLEAQATYPLDEIEEIDSFDGLKWRYLEMVNRASVRAAPRKAANIFELKGMTPTLARLVCSNRKNEFKMTNFIRLASMSVKNGLKHLADNNMPFPCNYILFRPVWAASSNTVVGTSGAIGSSYVKLPSVEIGRDAAASTVTRQTHVDIGAGVHNIHKIVRFEHAMTCPNELSGSVILPRINSQNLSTATVECGGVQRELSGLKFLDLEDFSYSNLFNAELAMSGNGATIFPLIDNTGNANGHVNLSLTATDPDFNPDLNGVPFGQRLKPRSKQDNFVDQFISIDEYESVYDFNQKLTDLDNGGHANLNRNVGITPEAFILPAPPALNGVFIPEERSEGEHMFGCYTNTSHSMIQNSGIAGSNGNEQTPQITRFRQS